MTKVLFAGFHHLEAGTVRVLVHLLRARGCPTAQLVPLLDMVDTPVDTGPVYRHADRSILTELRQPNWRNALAAFIPVNLPDQQPLASGAVAKNIGLTRVFPVRAQEWVPEFRKTVETVLTTWKPDVVVLSPGQVDSPIVRRACAALKIPCCYVLPPYFEYKHVSRIWVDAQFRDGDKFYVADGNGAWRLKAAGVPTRSIEQTGAPLFDWMRVRVVNDVPNFTILSAHQQLPENERLDALLLRYVEEHPGTRLRIRLHPGTPREERQRIQTVRGEQAQVSAAGTRLVTDLSRSSVMVAVSSVALVEASLMGIPPICWRPGFLPPELTFDRSIAEARTYSELASLLDRVMCGELACQARPCATGPTATEIICDKILAHVPR